MSALLLGASLVFHEPVRRSVLTVLRFPFTVTTTCVRILIALPRLPALTRENAALHSDVLRQQLENAQLREALRHLQQARGLLEAVPSPPKGIVARVIGRSTIPTQQTMLLDKGARDGLGVDHVILDASGVVGRVIEVHPATALVLLLTDPESRVAGVAERSRETGLLVGGARGQCELIYLDVDADLQAGDRVMTAGLGGPFPKGLLLGYAVRMFRDEESGSARASVRPAARLGQLEEVLCLPATAP